MRITIAIGNETQFDREISRFSNGVSDFRVVAPSILTALRSIVADQFASQGRGLWRPLSKRYAAQKARKYPGKTILRRTDRMYDSLVKRTASSIVSINKNELTYGTSVPYASFHQAGTKKMPARKIIALTEADNDRIVKAVQARLVKLTKEGK